MDRVIDENHIARSCINPLEDLKRAVQGLVKERDEARAQLAAKTAEVERLNGALEEINKEATECLERGRTGDTERMPQPINYVCLIANKARAARWPERVLTQSKGGQA